MCEILKLTPAFKDYIWGGSVLKNIYGIDNMNTVAEAWVLSAHNGGQSTVCGGAYNGLTFSQALCKMGSVALGEKSAAFNTFPLLIKLIDAQYNLSVQVHPDNAFAQKNENQYGKTEMWYILNAAPGAGIYYGLKQKLSAAQLKQHIQNNTVTDILKFVPVKSGDSYFIPAGTIHAIGKGLLIAEIQQNSNTTYRLYDYERTDANGNTRLLHIEKGVAAATLEPMPNQALHNITALPDGTIELLASCKYFTVKNLCINGKTKINTCGSFTAVLITKGSGKINGIPFKKYNTFFVPANCKSTLLTGNFKALITHL